MANFCPLIRQRTDSPWRTSEERRRFSGFTLPKLRERVRAFTLMELLTVIVIISILLVLLAPAFTTRKSADDVTSAANSIKSALENARTYAKANNTYVFVGLAEVKDSVDSSVSPQVTTGGGRVAIATVASKDGSRHFQYKTSVQGSDWTAGYNNGANLAAITKLQVYENLHFLNLNFASWPPSSYPSSNMARYQQPNNTYNLGTATSSSVTQFTWPLGKSLSGGYQYKFTKVINFDPSGVARIATSTNSDEVTNLMEIDFLQSHGSVTPTPPPVGWNQDVGNQFVIQIDAPTGAVRLYRP